jgi:hypothetical protein
MTTSRSHLLAAWPRPAVNRWTLSPPSVLPKELQFRAQHIKTSVACSSEKDLVAAIEHLTLGLSSNKAAMLLGFERLGQQIDTNSSELAGLKGEVAGFGSTLTDMQQELHSLGDTGTELFKRHARDVLCLQHGAAALQPGQLRGLGGWADRMQAVLQSCNLTREAAICSAVTSVTEVSIASAW